MAKRRVSWVLVAMLLMAGLVFAMIGAGAFAYFRYFGVRDADVGEAERAFEDVLARFRHQEPWFVIDQTQHQIRLRRPLEPDASSKSFDAVHVLAWDDDEKKLVRLEIPGWIVRMRTASGAFDVTLDDGRSYKIDLKDLERMGPGLLIDHKEGRDRALIWLE